MPQIITILIEDDTVVLFEERGMGHQEIREGEEAVMGQPYVVEEIPTTRRIVTVLISVTIKKNGFNHQPTVTFTNMMEYSTMNCK